MREVLRADRDVFGVLDLQLVGDAPDLVVLDRDDRGVDPGDRKQRVDERELLRVRRDGVELARDHEIIGAARAPRLDGREPHGLRRPIRRDPHVFRHEALHLARFAVGDLMVGARAAGQDVGKARDVAAPRRVETGERGFDFLEAVEFRAVGSAAETEPCPQRHDTQSNAATPARSRTILFVGRERLGASRDQL